ncbi:MAG: DUF3313 family protein [Pseudomonadota bacterium]
MLTLPMSAVVESGKALCTRRLPALAATAMLAGCGAFSTQDVAPQTGEDTVATKITPGADFSRYRAIQVDQMAVYYPEGASTPEGDLLRIRNMFRSAFLRELDQFTVVEEAAADTLLVQGSLIDLRSSSVTADVPLPSELQAVAQPGSLVFVMELKDSISRQLLAQAADTTEAPSFPSAAGSSTDLSRVRQSAREWAARFRRFLDENLTL